MHSYAKALFYFMNWNEVICPACGLVNDYTIKEKSNNSVCTCNGCGKFLGNKPKNFDQVKMPFGKYKNKLVSDVLIEDYPYLQWFYKECKDKLSNSLLNAIKKALNIWAY